MAKQPEYDEDFDRFVISAQAKEVTTFALVDPDLMPDGLFTHIAPGTKRAQHTIIRGLKWKLEGRERRVDLERHHILGYDDLSVLIALMACALKSGTDRPDFKAPAEQRFLKFDTTAYRIAEECGWSMGGQTYKTIEESLMRLTKLSYIDHGDWSGSNVVMRSEGLDQGLLGYTQIKTDPDNPIGEILYEVKINTKITDNLIGTYQGDRFIRIDMEEYRCLSPLERLVYARLCLIVYNPTENRRVRKAELMLNTLFDKIYQVGGEMIVNPVLNEKGKVVNYDVVAREDSSVSTDTIKKRRSAIRKALKRINEFEGWNIEIETRNNAGHKPKILIKRTFCEKPD